MIMLLNLIFFVVISAFYARADIPADAAKVLKKLPGEKLSVEFVVAKAYSSSDSLRAVKSQALAIESSYWQSLIPVSTQVYLASTYSKNENTNASLFDPRDSRLFVLGATKYFSTGTLLGVEVNELQTTLAPQNVFVPAEKTTAKVTLSQSLWKDAFGAMTRNNIAAGEKMRDASRLVFEQAIQDWALGLIRVYYGAWFSKSQLVAAKTNMDRRQRLLDVTKLKLGRGTSERPDFLQVESALLQSRAAYQQSLQDLQKTWRELVTSLKLPSAWMEIPADVIPLDLDRPFETALQLCQQKENFDQSRTRSLSHRLASLKSEASRKKLEASKSALAPELALEGSYATSGSVGSYSQRSNDAFSARNPEWSVGVKFKMPLEFYAEKAQAARDASEHELQQALFDKEQNDHLTGWINGCAQLKMLSQNRQFLETSAKNLSERSQLEEKRFRLGRVPTLNVILAGDEYSAAEVQLNQTKIALNQAAWDILKLNGSMEEYLNTIIKSAPSVEF
jgi:outer membrane protein TolC